MGVWLDCLEDVRRFINNNISVIIATWKQPEIPISQSGIVVARPCLEPPTSGSAGLLEMWSERFCSTSAPFGRKKGGSWAVF